MNCRAAAVAVIFAFGCKSKSNPAPQPEPHEGSGTAAAGSGSGSGSGSAPAPVESGLDLDGIDKSVKPGDDFAAYANGAWDKKTEIPADRAAYGTGSMVEAITAKRNVELIKDAAANGAAGTDARRVGDYYTAYMDEAGIEAKGLAPLQPELDAIAAITDAKQLAHALGDATRADVDAINNTNPATPHLFGLWIAQDFVEPTKYSVFLLQGGLVLPDRDFYLSKTPQMVELRGKYVTHVGKMLGLAKIADGEAKAKAIVDLETKLATAHLDRVAVDDVKNGLTHWTRADLAKKAPGLDWDEYLTAAGVGAVDSFVIWMPKATTGIAAVVKSVPLATWKDYLTFHAIEEAAPFLPKAFVDEQFAFFGTALAGTPTQRDRWKRGVDATSHALGEAVGKLYVDKYFPASEKTRAQAMVAAIIAAFNRRIDALAWMSPETKAKAKAKLAVLKVGVGYPDTWRDYGGLEIKPDDAFGNAERASRFETAYQIAKLGKPVDRGEWVMVPHLVNAVNLPAMNAMNFPAAILQPPYFDPNRPEVMDYGAIGSVIGHEISHSFDNNGALFDADGKLANWWTKADFDHFAQSGKALALQYDAYQPFPDVHLDGKLVLGENIADVAGLSAAYDAYKAALPDAKDWKGLTPDQQFFLSFAQMWRGKYREAALRASLVTNGHSPNPWRIATVRNLDAWYAAFDVQPGQARYLKPEDRVKVW